MRIDAGGSGRLRRDRAAVVDALRHALIPVPGPQVPLSGGAELVGGGDADRFRGLSVVRGGHVLVRRDVNMTVVAGMFVQSRGRLLDVRTGTSWSLPPRCIGAGARQDTAYAFCAAGPPERYGRGRVEPYPQTWLERLTHRHGAAKVAEFPRAGPFLRITAALSPNGRFVAEQGDPHAAAASCSSARPTGRGTRASSDCESASSDLSHLTQTSDDLETAGCRCGHEDHRGCGQSGGDDDEGAGQSRDVEDWAGESKACWPRDAVSSEESGHYLAAQRSGCAQCEESEYGCVDALNLLAVLATGRPRFADAARLISAAGAVGKDMHQRPDPLEEELVRRAIAEGATELSESSGTREQPPCVGRPESEHRR